MERSAVTRRVWELAEPLVLGAGLELVDVQYRPEGGRLVLRLLIDRPEGGVTIDELARVSRERTGVVAIGGKTVIAQMVLADLRMAQRLTAIDQQHVEARLRQHVRNDTAAGARADHDGVVLGSHFIYSRGAQRR